MNQVALPFDICAGRHRGNAFSREANPSEEKKRVSHERILLLLSLGPKTSKEIAGETGWPLNTFSGRLTELLAAHRIERTGEKRDGCAVVRIKA